MILSRRLAMGVIGAGVAVPARVLAKVNSSTVQLGAQTNAWPIDATKLDTFLEVLQQIRKTGYDGFETGYFNLAQHLSRIEEVRSAIHATGLTFFGLHIAVGADKCDPNTLLPIASLYEPWAKTAKAFGAQHLILSSIPSKASGDARKKADGLRRAVECSHSAGIPLLYHNHGWEFANGGSEMNTLFDSTADMPLKFLLDAGHAFHAGADIPSLLQNRLDRVAAFHLRDYRDGKQVALGSGTFPLDEVAKILKARKWSGWVINEEDNDGKQKLGLEVIEPAHRVLESAFR